MLLHKAPVCINIKLLLWNTSVTTRCVSVS